MLHAVPTAYRTPSGMQCYLKYIDLATKPHLLIAGATGSGKSVALNGIIVSILMKQSPFRCQFILIDPKRVELMQYKTLPHVIRYASEPPDIVRSLQLAVDETERRFAYMQQGEMKEYDGTHLYVFIDELADLMVSLRKETLPLLQKLAQIGRAARVHLFVCTQNVLAVTIPTVLKCNFSSVLGLRTMNKQQSRMLISESGCEMLPNPAKEGKGYGFLRDGAELEKILIYKYPDEDIEAVVRWWMSSECIAM